MDGLTMVGLVTGIRETGISLGPLDHLTLDRSDIFDERLAGAPRQLMTPNVLVSGAAVRSTEASTPAAG